MDFKTLAQNLLKIAETAAPLVGLADEVKAGKALVDAISNTFDTVRGSLDNDDQAELQGTLEALKTRVNAHADKTIGSL